MSYIDTLDHEFVGFFAGLPIYHPLEVCEGEGPDSADFACSPANLVLGGGDGEHPGLVLVRPDCAVSHYLTDSRELAREDWRWHGSRGASPELGAWEPFVALGCTVPLAKVWTYAAWSRQRHAEFEERCRSPILHWPYDRERHGALDRWLAAIFGELVYFSLRELLPEPVRALPDSPVTRRPIYLNILVPPPGFPAPYGRRTIGDSILWGQSRWSDGSRSP